jgi:hypothetical protein
MATKKKAAKRKAAKKRELVKPAGDARYIRRDERGEWSKSAARWPRSPVQSRDGCQAGPRR